MPCRNRAACQGSGGAPRYPWVRIGLIMEDPFGRLITYIRVSVTDRCNLKCVYCIPDGMEWIERDDILSYEEIARLVGVFARMGVRKVRLTGGEPTVRKDLPELVRLIRSQEGIEEMSLS